MLQRTPSMMRSYAPLYPMAALLLAATIFGVDTFSSLDSAAIAVSYVVVILISSNSFSRRGLVAVGVLCAILTLTSFAIVHGNAYESDPFARCLISICAIGITTFLTLKNQQATLDLRHQAALLELTHDAIIVRDGDDVITYWNAGAEEEYGWTSEQAVGQRATVLLRTRFPDTPRSIALQLHAADRWEGELTHTKRDGTEVVVASRWSLQRDERGRPGATMEINNDITERRRADEKLRQAERELRQAIDTIPGMVWTASAEDGAMVLFNARWSDLGWTAAQVAEGQWQSVVHPDDAQRLEAEWSRSLATGEPFEAECRVRSVESEYRWLLARAAPLRDDNGQILRWYGINTDIEDRRRAEDALHKTQAELAHVTRVTTMGELTASIAHEVNQPLAAVVTNGEACLRWLMRDVPDLDEVRSSVERMISDGRRASQVVARLRALVRKSDPRQVKLSMNEIVNDVLLLVERELIKQRVALKLDMEPSPPLVLGDRVQLQQVVINLVMNAVQAMSDVTDRPRVLSISSRSGPPDSPERSIILEVRDTGVGIDPSSMAQLFTAFHTTKADGMGMGLSICRSIVEAHAGRISAVTGQERGACFVVRLPVKQEVLS
jgi:PAS domain S-box-containing protein